MNQQMSGHILAMTQEHAEDCKELANCGEANQVMGCRREGSLDMDFERDDGHDDTQPFIQYNSLDKEGMWSVWGKFVNGHLGLETSV